MASRVEIFIFRTIFGGQKLHTYFSSLRVRGTSLLICSYIGELCNGRKFRCEIKPFIVFISIQNYSRWDEFDVTRR